MIERATSEYLKALSTWFPVVSVTGPRQSGKSTLVQAVFPDYAYENLETPRRWLRRRKILWGLCGTGPKN